jgi:hypothetical protein
VSRATLAAIGAYYFSTALAFAALNPIRYSLPRYGTIFYDPLVTILAVMTAVGAGVAAGVAYAYGGVRAFSIVAILAAGAAASVVLPLIAEGARAWTVPSDLVGITPATAILLSWLPAVPALLLGVVGARRFVRQRASPAPALEAAGGYYLTGIAMSLPTPQLDLRLTLPYSAMALPDVWHAVAVTVPAIVAGLVLSGAARPLWKTAALGAVIGLAGTAPVEISILTGIGSGYWPVSLVAVPAATAAIASAVVVARRAFGARRWSFGRVSPSTAAALGAAAAFVAIGAWAGFATMPNPSDRSGPVGSYQRTGDERKIVACVTSGRGEQLLGSSAREDQAAVTVSVRLRRLPSWYFHDLAGISLPVVVALRDPLGNRAVIDASSGRSVPEVSRTDRSSFGSWC